MRRARGEHGIVELSGPRVSGSRPTFQCKHCGKHSILVRGVKPDEMGGFCRLCMGPTCTTCAGKGCVPFERRLEQVEARGRLLAAMGL